MQSNKNSPKMAPFHLILKKFSLNFYYNAAVFEVKILRNNEKNKFLKKLNKNIEK